MLGVPSLISSKKVEFWFVVGGLVDGERWLVSKDSCLVSRSVCALVSNFSISSSRRVVSIVELFCEGSVRSVLRAGLM